ncbi:AbrB/MazE/SpoVT family DNA-binding domain-containing protein [Candidatus Roizmanbacteria bacterium]|nr:AbrB/MazE/SpoVT family DNA-binding domain-containing protein [Candidatus Roizmanbacteria bacterium]
MQTSSYTRTITVKGQVTIPLVIRQKLKIKPQDKVVFIINKDTVELQPPKHTLDSLFTQAKQRKSNKKYSDKEMIEIAKQEFISQKK